MGKVKRLMMYFSDENFSALQEEAMKRGHPSIQSLIRETIRETLEIDLSIADFLTDALCPQCGVAGQLVKQVDGKVTCLNCNFSRT
jgi:hypothetical protein